MNSNGVKYSGHDRLILDFLLYRTVVDWNIVEEDIIQQTIANEFKPTIYIHMMIWLASTLFSLVVPAVILKRAR